MDIAKDIYGEMSRDELIARCVEMHLKLNGSTCALDVVTRLNDDLFMTYGDEQHQAFGYSSDGCSEIIEFAGIRLWHSDDDPRDFIEDANDYEDLYEFIRKTYNEKLKELASRPIKNKQ